MLELFTYTDSLVNLSIAKKILSQFQLKIYPKLIRNASKYLVKLHF